MKNEWRKLKKTEHLETLVVTPYDGWAGMFKMKKEEDLFGLWDDILEHPDRSDSVYFFDVHYAADGPVISCVSHDICICDRADLRGPVDRFFNGEGEV